jgi:hypothetical protein
MPLLSNQLNFYPSVSMSSPKTRQESFAENLKGANLGTALYHPVQLKEHSGRVGDIAFFNNEGKYQWLRNAFHTEVEPEFETNVSNSQTLRAWNWAEYTQPEENAVAECDPGHFRVALGGNITMTERDTGTDVDLPVLPGSVPALLF